MARLRAELKLEQRKNKKLEMENVSLNKRINDLISKQDDQRIELLVVDKTKVNLINNFT